MLLAKYFSTWSQHYKHHYSQILKLGLPIVIGQLGVILVSFVDNIMVGHHSAVELSAASYVNNFLGIFYVAIVGFSCGLTPMVAAAHKLEDHTRLGHLLKGSFWLNMLVALVISLIAFLFSFRLGWFNLSPDLEKVALPYYYIQVIGLLLGMMFCSIKQFFDGMSKTVAPMLIALLGNLVNIIFNYLLIYGHWGFPELGLIGAGIATTLGRIVMFLVIFILLLRHKEWQPIILIARKTKRIASLIYKELTRIGAPVALQMGLEAFSFTIAVVLVAKLGDTALAAHQVMITITTLGYLVYYGIGSAVAIHISHFRAEKQFVEVRRAAQAATHMGMLNAFVVSVFILCTRHFISYLFTDDANVAAFAALGLLPVVFYQFGDVLQVIYGNSLRGMEQVKALVPVAILCHVIVSPTLGYLLGFVLFTHHPIAQFTAIWCAFPVSLTMMGVLLNYFFRRVVKRAH